MSESALESSSSGDGGETTERRCQVEGNGKADDATSQLAERRREKESYDQEALRQPTTNLDAAERINLLEQMTFRSLFYAHGLSPAEVMALLNLSARNVATLMRIHNVGPFGYREVEDTRRQDLRAGLTPVEVQEVLLGESGSGHRQYTYPLK